MPHVATMGASSCATISIGGFKAPNSYENNEAYKTSGVVPESEGFTVKEFYSKVLYPVAQPLGKTRDLPFVKLMQDIDDSQLQTKLVVAVLNHAQRFAREGYWHNELKSFNFGLVTKTKNSIGSINYMYIRNPGIVPIEEGEG